MKRNDALDVIIESKLSEEEKQRLALKLICMLSYSKLMFDDTDLEILKKLIKEKEDVQSKNTPTTV